MGNNWIIDVLADLRSYAQKNNLPLLSVQLEETAMVAKAEIAQLIEGAPSSVQGEAAETRPIFIQTGSSRRS